MGIYGAALRELEQYRRDEAAGLLLRLPVPLGATVWRVRDNPACHYGVRAVSYTHLDVYKRQG